MLLETFKTTKLRYLLTLFSLLCLLVLPYDALAADQGYGSFWYGPNEQSTNGVQYIKTGIVASNKYDAALYALGFSKTTVTGISNGKKNKLISNSTFSSFANGFKTGKPDDDAVTLIPGIPTVGLNTNSMLTAWYAANAMYGQSNCYWSIYSKDSADTAYDAAYKIIKGGTSSGGGSGGSGSVGGGVMDTGDLPDTVELLRLRDIPVAQWQSLEMDITGVKSRNPDANRYPYCVVQVFSNGVIDANYPVDCRVEVLFLTSNDFEYYWDDEKGGAVFVSGVNMGNYEFGGTTTLKSDGTFTPFVYSGGKSWSAQAGQKVLAGGNARYLPVIYASYISQGYVGGGDDEPTEPPVDWPEPDPTPTPPVPPDPVTPDPPTPWNPIPDIDIDITGDDFQDLLDALNEHCIHLQNSISSNISQLWELQSDLFSDHMNTFWDNLHNDLLWLGECLNFDVNVNVDGGSSGGDDGSGEGDTTTYVPFDDSSVIYWLKQIWSKLGNGISIRPVDPVVNPDGWWDWFTNLLGGLIGALADVGLDKIGGLVDALDTLREKFPFCIPWDIAALLGLLVSEPVTPVIELPLMALSGSNGVQQVGSMVIDLDAYSDAWEAVRWIERIAFCVYLATRTKDFLDLLGKIKG